MIKGILTSAGKIMGTVILVGGIGTLLWKVFVYTDNINDHNAMVEKTLNRVVEADSIQCVKIDSITTTLQKLNVNVDELTKSHVALRDDYVHRLSETLTTEEFLRLMEELGITNGLKKNSVNNEEPTVSGY